MFKKDSMDTNYIDLNWDNTAVAEGRKAINGKHFIIATINVRKRIFSLSSITRIYHNKCIMIFITFKIYFIF